MHTSRPISRVLNKPDHRHAQCTAERTAQKPGTGWPTSPHYARMSDLWSLTRLKKEEQMKNTRRLQMKCPILENSGSTPQVLPGLLVGEQMKTPGTDEELKKTHRWRRPGAVRQTLEASRVCPGPIRSGRHTSVRVKPTSLPCRLICPLNAC